MYRRPFFATALLGLALLLPALARADEQAPKSDKPAVLLRFASLDHLRGDFRYLAKVVGQAEKAKQLDGILKSQLGDEGLKGIDTKKPIGAYGWVGAFGIDSKAVLLVPIADKKAFLDLIANMLEKPDKGDDDVYTLNVDKVPAPVYFRFANDYAYITVRDKEVLEKDKLLAPAAVLPAGQIGTVSVILNVDEIPEDLKEKALGAIDNQLAGLKDKEMPGHTEAQKAFRDAAIDELGARIKSLLNHGGETTLRLDLDRKAGDVTLTASVAGKPGSPLAKTIRDLGQVKSWTASLLHPGSALKAELNVSLPEKLRALLGPALKDAEKQTLAKAKDDSERDVVKTLLEGVMPTLKAAELDTAVELSGPSDNGIYTLLGGIKIKDGAKMEKSFRTTAARYPGVVKLDAEKVDHVGIHRINPDKNLKAGARRAFGENPLYVAFRDEVMFIGAGDKGLGVLKEALTASPRTGKVMEVQMALARLAPLADNQTNADIARKVFSDPSKNNDRVRITLEGGKALTLRVSMGAKLLDYVNQVEKAKRQ
ncbi:MAG TPA: hypothetical protein VMG10_32485 [Gemmataceae bacterium]|nr:hypothetical protein [Gemmataceae bacterium]